MLSLDTNIRHNEGIDACRHFLNTLDHNASSMSTETLCDRIRMILAQDWLKAQNDASYSSRQKYTNKEIKED